MRSRFALSLVRQHALQHLADGSPSHAQKLSELVPVRLDGEPSDEVFEGASEAATRTRPRHQRDHHAVLTANDAR